MEFDMDVVREAMNPALKRIHKAALHLFAEKGASQINVSELAHAAGVARGTIYNNLNSTDDLFEEIADQLEVEMLQRTAKSATEIDDPALRLSNGIRFFIRRTHEEPEWGRFFVRFAFTSQSLRNLWGQQPAEDLLRGMESGRYTFRRDQLPTALAMIAGSVQAAMMLVLEGHKTWRDAGADTAELLLKALGVDSSEARALSTTELPPLPAVD
jgi:AcrR family transcriptional regulator